MNEALQIVAGLVPEKFDPHKLKTLAAFERDYIELVVKICEGNVVRAAKILDIAPSTLYRKRTAWANRPTSH